MDKQSLSDQSEKVQPIYETYSGVLQYILTHILGVSEEILAIAQRPNFMEPFNVIRTILI